MDVSVKNVSDTPRQPWSIWFLVSQKQTSKVPQVKTRKSLEKKYLNIVCELCSDMNSKYTHTSEAWGLLYFHSNRCFHALQTKPKSKNPEPEYHQGDFNKWFFGCRLVLCLFFHVLQERCGPGQKAATWQPVSQHRGHTHHQRSSHCRQHTQHICCCDSNT